MILIPGMNLLVVGTVFDEKISSGVRPTGDADVDFGIFTLRLLDSSPFVASLNPVAPNSAQLEQVLNLSKIFYRTFLRPILCYFSKYFSD